MNESKNQGSHNLNEHLSDLLLTVKEVAQHIDESPHVIRNWLRELKNHIDTQKGENNYHYFNSETIKRLLLIKTLTRDQGYSLKQVDFFLTTGEDPLLPEAKPDQQNEILQELQNIKDNFKKQEQFNQVLLKKLEERDQYINNSINKRDKQITEAFREIQQGRIEAVATEEKKGFWTRLFNKK